MPKNDFSVLHTSFTKRIAAFFSAAVIALLICFGVMSYMLTRLNAENGSHQTMNDTGSLISGVLDDHIRAEADRLDIIAKNENLKKFVSGMNKSSSVEDVAALEGFSDITEALDLICENGSGVTAAWVISEQKGFLVGNGGKVMTDYEYGLYDKHWYENYNTGKLKLSEYTCSYSANGVYGDDSAENGYLTVILPVASDGGVYAFCGLETTADSIFGILSKYRFNMGSYPLVSLDGDIVYSSDELNGVGDFSLSDYNFMKVAGRTSMFSESVDSYFSDDGSTVYYYQKMSTVSGLNVIVIFDSRAINGNVYKIFMQQILILICLCALVFIFMLNVLHRESSPLHEIRDCTGEMTEGNFNYRIKEISRNELGTVAENINKISEIVQAKNNVITACTTLDSLTGLGNRSRLYERLYDIIKTREEGRSRFAVMFVDIDNFRWLNETLGHIFGDAVLTSFAGILKEQLPHDISLFRFSGDEFILIKEFDDNYSEIQEVIDILHNCFSKPIEIMNDKIYIKFSVGVSIYPDDDTMPDMLLRNAELALHRAKDGGKDRVAFYTNTENRQGGFSKATISRCLSEALKNGELYLNYQPIISTETSDIHGFEVLLRWISPELGVVPPADFIGVAEESGNIIQIGTWIFECACRTLRQINETLNPDIIMSINVSPVQLKKEDYIDHIRRVIDITRVNPKNIQLEITESTLIDFTDSKSSVINEINELGISLALDDFGTGYSSLNYLKNFPIKCLKIDKSFIDEINDNKRDYAITDSIIDLVHNLGIHTVAEGIETVGQYTFLAEMKCDYIQGFLMSKPLEENDAIEFVERYNDLHKPDKHKLEENEKQLADEREQIRREQEHTDENGGASSEHKISK